MRDSITERAYALAHYIIDNNATVRAAARAYGVSKSTVHKDVTERLEHVNSSLYNQVKLVLNTNKEERHIRGGIATREKYHSLQQ